MSIKVENLKYVYSKGLPNETVALDDINFEIEDGQFVGIIGHTGSGKSTLLQQLNGLLKPSRGKVIVDGIDITEPGTKMVNIRKKVGLVFQYPEYQLFEESVEKDIAFGPQNLGVKGEQLSETVKWAIETVGLDYEKIKDRSPFELSGGQKRRVAIAGVIAMKPRVLILDEPTAGLDPQAHKDILEAIKNIQKHENIILIFVTHKMEDIQKLADRVLVLDKGKLLLDGKPQEVFSNWEFLRSIGLSVPPITELMKSLQKKIPEIEGNIFSAADAEEELYRYLTRREND